MYKVEHDIKIPSAALKAKKYPFREMVVGDSFAVPGYSRELHQRVWRAVYAYSKASLRSFTARRDGDDLRVWRLPDDSRLICRTRIDRKAAPDDPVIDVFA